MKILGNSSRNFVFDDFSVERNHRTERGGGGGNGRPSKQKQTFAQTRTQVNAPVKWEFLRPH